MNNLVAIRCPIGILCNSLTTDVFQFIINIFSEDDNINKISSSDPENNSDHLSSNPTTSGGNQ